MTVTPAGDHNRINNLGMFERILVDVRQAELAEPARVFGTATPGFLASITEFMGPWQGRNQVSWEFNGKGEKARVVGRREKAKLGGYDKKRIMALPGEVLAGHSQFIHEEDFIFGMRAQDAATKAALPILEWNRVVAEQLLDTFVQGAKYKTANSFANDFAWEAEDNAGNTITQQIVTDDANTVPTVVANDSQTILWPDRDGDEHATGHDHMAATGAAITAANITTAVEALTEHPGVGMKMEAICGKNVIEDVTTLVKDDYGEISERIKFQHQGIAGGGGFCDSSLRVSDYKDVDWHYSTDMPADFAVYFPRGAKPLYLSVGQSGPNGQIDPGSWSEKGGAELGGLTYGFRQAVTMGVQNPVGLYISKYA